MTILSRKIYVIELKNGKGKILSPQGMDIVKRTFHDAPKILVYGMRKIELSFFSKKQTNK